MKLKDKLKEYKPLHWIYNLLHVKQLHHNKEAYSKYRVHKPLFDSISSKDFPDKISSAWLDVNDSANVVATKESYQQFNPDIQEQLQQWSSNGFLHIKQHFSSQQVDDVNKAVDELIHQKQLPITHDNKVMYGYKHSPVIKQMMQDEGLKKLLSFILEIILSIVGSTGTLALMAVLALLVIIHKFPFESSDKFLSVRSIASTGAYPV